MTDTPSTPSHTPGPECHCRELLALLREFRKLGAMQPVPAWLALKANAAISRVEGTPE